MRLPIYTLDFNSFSTYHLADCEHHYGTVVELTQAGVESANAI